jgi:uncharacterized membrane protein
MLDALHRSPSDQPIRDLRLPAALIGFGFGGFFDGILLHQILQWHHLLSALDQGRPGDLAFQVMADGLFHAVMYVIAAVGLVYLLRRRSALAAPDAARAFGAVFLIGFGLWHVVDTLLSHWLLGIHRIRMDVANPLLWDVGWLVVFGLLPLLAGWWWQQRAGQKEAARALPLLLVGATAVAALASALPWNNGTGTVTVVLRPDVSAGPFLSKIGDARVVWADDAVWVLQPAADTRPLSFYRAGAMYVSGTLAPAGCAAWLAR